MGWLRAVPPSSGHDGNRALPQRRQPALRESEKETVSTLATLAAGLAGGLTGDSTASALAGAQTGKTVVENNLLAPSEYSALSKALDDFDKGKNPLEAAKQIVSLTNKDNVTDGLLYQLQQGKPLSEQDKRILASALDQYGYELQTKYGYTEQQAFAAIEKVNRKSGTPTFLTEE
ncbi:MULTISPECIES: VENN motif pre-toxin domain-containing protein [Aeromonas]|uniref:VENN motif pre-toxin domain-containing protein n=1 Tax=Aeromonas TaxID=642 RepID=UPI002B058F9A|nr:VENN motif pre-toxin domain-containing protein [Aeromonas jandaei]